MAIETQALLDELKTPTIKTPASANVAIKAFSPEGGAIRRQVAMWLDLLQQANITEIDDGLYDLFRQLQQTIEEENGAVAGLAESSKYLVAAYRQMATLDGVIRQYITDNGLGYTV